MRTTESITLTNKRQYDPLKLLVNQIIDDRNIEETINKTVDASKIRTGVLVKFYPYLDKAEVKLDNIDKSVLCRIFHRFGGSLIDFFTPEGEQVFCETLKEPCILPREELHVLVADISNEDAKEMLLLGYYHPNDIIGIRPANPNYFKLTNIGATNMWGIEIGNGEIKTNTMNGVTFTEGEFHADNTEVNYANTEDMYTKKEVYTKTEVDNLLNNMKQEIIRELTTNNTNNNVDGGE